jgi:uncharacterized protein (TIGR00369 family)
VEDRACSIAVMVVNSEPERRPPPSLDDVESRLAAGDVGDDVGTLFQQSLGLRWTIVDKDSGTLTVEMTMRDDLRGPAGSLEGGVVSTLIDVAGASAIAMKAGAMVATQHMTVNFLAPGRSGPIKATGSPLRIGKHDGVAEVKVVDTGRDDRLMAVGTVTVRLLR